MFQTFTGSSRRPRQVNLSGRNTNPFAAVQQKSAPPGSPAAVLQAQHDRKARQQERERLQAARAIQRTWRGHLARKEVTLELRRRWDIDQEILKRAESCSAGYEGTLEHLPHLKLLLRFCDPSRAVVDVYRLSDYVSIFAKWMERGKGDGLNQEWAIPLIRLAKLTLSVLGLADHKLAENLDSKIEIIHNLVLFLRHYIDLFPDLLSTFSQQYFSSLSKLLFLHLPSQNFSPVLRDLVTTPLQQCGSNPFPIYEGLLVGLLTVPGLQSRFDLDSLAAVVDTSSLCLALQSLLANHNLIRDSPHDILSWLLAYYTRLYRISADLHPPSRTTEMEHIAAVSMLLSNLAPILNGQQNMHDTTDSTPLPAFVSTEITSLINQQTITNLLAHAESIDSLTVRSLSYSNDAAVLASYVLTLIQVFPRRSDEIRMWLYMGSTLTKSDFNGFSERLPAIKFFYRAVSRTRVFRTIYKEPHGAVALLGLKQRKQYSNKERSQLEQEWRIVLLFLELYTFVLKIMDDEEFMSGGEFVEEQKSWTRQSALKLSEVKDLIVFLKNFAFAMYWYTTEINGDERDVEPRGLKSYFGSTDEILSPLPAQRKQSAAESLVIPGIQSSSTGYMKGTVTGLLRMLYERDSRRRFLPKDHWLMREFDMSGFIGAVLEEQKRRSEHHEEDDDEDIMDEDFDTYDREAGLIGTSRTQAVRRVERLKRQQQKSARRRKLEDTVPRLNILENMPFFIPFATRVQIFREFVRADQEIRRNGFVDPDQWRMAVMHHGFGGGSTMASRDQYIQSHSAKVRREQVFEDAYEQFYPLGEGLKEPIQITFVDQFDTPEAGIDGGGVTKEFLTSVTNEAFFKPTEGDELFVENDQHLLYPNPELVDKRKNFLDQAGLKEGSAEWNEAIRELLHRYEFLGRVVGKCLYEGILIDIHFAPFFLVKWALTGGSGSATNESGYRANINDLRDLDESLYQGLLKLKNYPGNVEDFGLDFTINDTISFRDGSETQTVTRELRPNGSDVPVTNENRLVYISYVARHRLQAQPYLQTSAFLKGLGTMIQPSWLSMFNQSELQTLIGGDSSEIDVSDLRRYTQYGGVYVIGDDGEEHPTIKLFWEIMEELCDDDTRKLLKYVTSTPRAPLLGFSQLQPRFSIRDSGRDQSRLPSTSTCVNLLKLPIYDEKQVMKDKLVYAINAGAGFNLS